MNRSLLLILSCTIILAAHVGCSSNVYVARKFLAIHKGLSAAEVKSLDTSITSPQPIALKLSSTDTTGHYTLLVSQYTAFLRANTIIYAFKDDSLLYWGYPHLFLRHESTEIRQIGEESLKRLQLTAK